MIQSIMKDFEEKNITIEQIIISSILDEFLILYESNQLSASEQIECLDFINTLFKMKHKYIVNYQKERRSYSRDTQMYHLKKLYNMISDKLKKEAKPKLYKKYEPPTRVLEFKELIKALNKKAKADISKRTQKLLEELMKEKWSIQEKTELIKSLLSEQDANFNQMLETEDKEEIITSFLALLDLKRKGEINITQERNFGEIIISKKAVRDFKIKQNA